MGPLRVGPIRRARIRRTAAVCLVLVSLSSCLSSPSPTPTSVEGSPLVILPLGTGEMPLVTQVPFSAPPGVPILCGGVGLDAVLRGDSADPRLVWLENRIPGTTVKRIEAVWPAGYRVRFTPKAEVLDAFDRVMLRDGDAVLGACGVGPDGAHLQPPFR